MTNHVSRSAYVDIIKGWAMLTIITFHCSSNFIRGGVSELLGNPWNVPIFFIIAGFFLKEESLNCPGAFLKKKIKSLYAPATIIYTLSVLLHNFFISINWYPLGESHPATGVPFAYYSIREVFVRLLKVLLAAGSGELAMGAMWFLYSLLYAFVGMVFLYYVISIFQKDSRKRYHYMTIVLFIIASSSCVLSQNFAITISRFSTSATAMFLIWWGMIINKKWQWKYDQGWACLLAFFIFVHCILRCKDEMVLAQNQYQSLPYLVVGCASAIYCWGYIGKKIEGSWIGKALALLGRESLYFMAFHIIGFFICNSLMVQWGIFTMDSPRGLYTFKLGDNGWLLLVYVAFGVIVPLAIMYAFRKLKSILLNVLLHRTPINL